MARLECGDDAFDTAAVVKRFDRFVVGNRHILRTPRILQPCMLGTDAGVIKAGRYRMGFDDLAVDGESVNDGGAEPRDRLWAVVDFSGH